MSQIEQAIEAYTSIGWSIFPLQPGRKIPFPRTRGVKDATTDRQVLLDWARRYPQMNLGIDLGASGLFVVDVDERSGGHQTVERLAGQGKTIPPTLSAHTAQNGVHRYFHAPRGVRIKNAKGKLPGIDIKSVGGYTILPPSQLMETPDHRAGHYWWKDMDVAVRNAPRWLLDIIVEKEETVDDIRRRVRMRDPSDQPRGSPERRLQGMCSKLAALPSGNRNNWLYWASREGADMVKKGELGQQLVERELYNAARAAGLAHDETKKTIASAFTASFDG